MTEISNNAPNQDRHELAKISLTDQGRKIEFGKPCLSTIHIYRKTNKNEWQEVAKNVRFPYEDKEPMPASSEITYKIKVLSDIYQGEYEVSVFSGKSQ